MRNFIDVHLIKKIQNQITQIQKDHGTKYEGFYFFDDPIIDKGRVVNRCNRWSPYVEDQVIPSSWFTISGENLIKIYNQLKNYEFYIYKNVSCDFSPYIRAVKYRIKTKEFVD